MARITVEEAQEFNTFPDDTILHLKVEAVEVKNVESKRGDWQKLEWQFKILGIQVIGDGSPVELYENQIAGNIWGSCSFKLTDHPENKLRLWAEAVLQVPELGIGYELDTDHFIGREVRGVTSTYEKRSKDRQGNPYKGQQVDSLLQMGGGFSAPAPAAQQNPWANQQAAQQAAAPPPQPQPAATGPSDPWGNGWQGDEPPF